MQAQSDRFFLAVRDGGRVVSKLEVYQSGIYQATLVDTLDGSVGVDSTTAVRRTGQFRISDASGSYTIKDTRDLLLPYHTEIVPYRGFHFGYLSDGQPDREYSRLGTLVLTDTDINWPHVSLDCADRMHHLMDNDMEALMVAAVGTKYEKVIQDMIEGGMPAQLTEYNFPDTGELTPLLIFEQSVKRGDEVMKLAANLGQQLFADPNGVFTMAPEADPTTFEPVWEYVEGSESMLLTANKAYSRRGVYNRVVLHAENPNNVDTKYRAEAVDTDPDSPTQYGGPFGRQTRIETSSLPANQSQANSLARKLLQQQLGLVTRVSFTGHVNPAHEGRDIIRVMRTKSGIEAVHVLDKFTIPLQGSQFMPGETRERRAVAA